MKSIPLILIAVLLAPFAGAQSTDVTEPVQPRVVTPPTKWDTDDPAIWINPQNPAESLILGTDKEADGALYVYDLQGRIVADKVVRGLARPNNVDVEYDVPFAGGRIDIAVVAERFAHRLRVYRLPDMAPIDGGGIPVFEGERARDVMGIGLYSRPGDGAVFAIVSRSDFQAPRQGYLHQYRLVDDGTGTMRGVFSRAFGTWSGQKEIEALAVDDEAGFVYYSDETFGVRKYAADPMAEDAEDELAVFGTEGFARDHEGISIYRTGEKTGYIIVSDQQANAFRFFKREGEPGNPHEHRFVKSVTVAAQDSDGSDVTSVALPGYPHGLFVAMSTDQTFHFYAWEELAGQDLVRVPPAR